MRSDPLRIGLVGTGSWARKAHVPALLAHPEVEFTGVWGRDPDKTGAVARAAGVTAFASVDALLAASDAVAFAVSPGVQAPLAIKAAAAGKHLMLEKPIALNSSLAAELVRVVTDNEVASVVCFTGRWIPSYANWISDLVVQGDWECGRSEQLNGAMTEPSELGISPWRRDHGALWDLAPHGVAMLLGVLGDVASVVAMAGLRDQVHLALRHAAGGSSSLSASMTIPSAVPTGHSYYFYGARGWSSAPALDPAVNHQHAAYGCILDSLVDQLRRGTRCEDRDVRLGARVVAVLEAATASLRTGSVEAVSPLAETAS